ncbi:hypothetical protein PR202_ga25109 [Eleusine coracana subsp. coracana]|uniref:Uncharacterized protein n=1 Tax=Eleusine coracana subsp. coracana TaxID=191504 RepID=A0AAV5D8I5_ELECO|nr:hypothetical protein PR202_ga25109 [Eleusine coracana subsp. coracana]
MGAAAARQRPSCVALFLLPVFLPLALLCFPLLCVAVAVVRFRRRRRRMVRMSRCLGEGERAAEEEEGAGHRAALLHKYLEDQVRLVGVEPGAMDLWRPSSSCSQQGQAQQR